MSSRDMTDSELKKEIRKLNNSLSKRISDIRGMGDTVPQYAIKKYEELNIPENLRWIDRKELNSLYRQLKYIDNLKTSTLEGAVKAQNQWETHKSILNYMSEDYRNKFWEMYEKITEHMGGTYLAFKYNIMDIVEDYLFGSTSLNVDMEKAIDEIEKAYTDTFKELRSNPDEEEIFLLFTNKLQSFRK